MSFSAPPQSDRADATVASYALRAPDAGDYSAICGLHARRFGPGRFARSAYRVREGAEWPSAHCVIAETAGGDLLGSLTATPAVVAERGMVDAGLTGVLIGPIVVDEPFTRQTIAQKMIEACCDHASAGGEHFAILIGDLAYYQRVGFEIAKPPIVAATPRLPGPVDPERVLVRALNDADLSTMRGTVRAR